MNQSIKFHQVLILIVNAVAGFVFYRIFSDMGQIVTVPEALTVTSTNVDHVQSQIAGLLVFITALYLTNSKLIRHWSGDDSSQSVRVLKYWITFLYIVVFLLAVYICTFGSTFAAAIMFTGLFYMGVVVTKVYIEYCNRNHIGFSD